MKQAETLPGSRDEAEDRDILLAADLRRSIRELRVQQENLKRQNDELSKVGRELEASRNRYFDLYAFALVGLKMCLLPPG